MICGPGWSGRTRFAAELVARLTGDGAVRVAVPPGGPLADRLAGGLREAGLVADPSRAGRIRPFTADLGDVDDLMDEVTGLGRSLAGTQGLVIGCARAVPATAPFVALPPLADDDAETLVTQIDPALPAGIVARIVALGAGRPGVLTALARANGRRPSVQALRMPEPVARRIEPVLADLGPPALDLARWAAVIGTEFTAADLVRLTGRAEAGLGPLLDELVVAGAVEEIPAPGPVRMRFADPLLAELVRQRIPPNESRRRHAAVLAARRAAGDPAPDLVVHALGSHDADQVVELSLRAAELCRQDGDALAALAHAERAVSWCEAQPQSTRTLDARLEQGLALATLGRWDEATPVLEDVVHRQRRAGNDAAAVRAAAEWARVRFYLGYADEAFDVITDNVPDGEDASAERADALSQAAMFAVNIGRHSDARAWAERAYAEATASGEHLAGIRALMAMGIAEVRSTARPDGLARLREALALARAGGHVRQVALALNNESVCLLMLGMVREAAERARQGLEVVETHEIAELNAPLTQNLAEALAAMGRLTEARTAAQRSRAAFVRLGSRALEPLDSLLGWIDFLEGKIPRALEALRAIWTDAEDKLAIEQMGPAAAFHTHVAAAAGETDEARQIARTGLGRWRDTEERVDALGLLAAACEVLPPSECGPLVVELRAAADAGAPIASALAAYAEAWIGRSPEDAAALFREAATGFAETGMEWWAARAMMLAGERDPDDGAAVDDLLDARRRFRAMEAADWRARCEAQLRQRGYRFVIAPTPSHVPGFSAREVEVLEHLAAGLTNREIAESLYISEKTAGGHLERIYKKLGVRTRAAAVRAATERGLVADPVRSSEGLGSAG